MLAKHELGIGFMHVRGSDCREPNVEGHAFPT